MDSNESLIAKKLSGELNQTEEKSFQEWFMASAEHQALFKEYQEVWEHASFETHISGQEEVYSKIANKLNLASSGQQFSQPSKRVSYNFYWLRVAAILCLVLGTTFLVYWNEIRLTAHTKTEQQPAVMITKSNPRGQKSNLRLPDGTQVKLNADSYLEYASDFAEAREVKLVGEAFFDVVSDSLKPFVVNAGDVQVKVLGTSFNVQAFPFEEVMTVAVASGSVMVARQNEKQSESSQLKPMEMLKVNHKTGTFEKGKFKTQDLLAWKDGVLVFHQATFEEIIHKLKRWYGVDFIIQRKTPITDGFTGRYNNTSLEVVLEGMSFSSDFTYRIEGKKVFIQ
ncbi:DUF4974 domain-containing protein [Porifericola rhodea]|uniref:FecR family protein n=1 Tax=Porifericola rhodea TaxID=930972 RepID=UPI0026671B13|nr:FecR family protein [Porifericola rhodea]WKN30650.1 DUF4974 domain-containing protein [Porifericola rhodea]